MKKMSDTVLVLGKCGHWFAHDPANDMLSVSGERKENDVKD